MNKATTRAAQSIADDLEVRLAVMPTSGADDDEIRRYLVSRLTEDSPSRVLSTRTKGELERLADRARDSWAVLRCVPANEGEAALRRHGIEYDEKRDVGSRDGLADDMNEIAALLRALAGELGT